MSKKLPKTSRLGLLAIKIAALMAFSVMLIGLIGWFIHYDFAVASVVANIFMALLIPLMFVRGGLVDFVKKYKKIVAATLVIFMLVFQLVVAYSTEVSHGWDIGRLDKVATSYLDGSYSQTNREYLSRYGNNLPIALVGLSIYSLAPSTGADGHSLKVFLNVWLLFAAELLVLRLIYNRLGLRAAGFAYFPVLALVALSPYLTSFYTDTVGLFFIASIMYVLDKLRGGFDVWWSLLLGVLIAGGLLAKVTSAIILLAIVIYASLFLTNYKKSILSSTLPALVAVLGLLSYGIFLQPKIEMLTFKFRQDVEQHAVSAWHFIGMGSLRGLEPYESCRDGGYCTPYVHDMIDIKDKQERDNYAKEMFNKSFSEDFPTGYVVHCLNKVSKSFGDGSFTAWREGQPDKLDFYDHETGFLHTLQEYFAPKTAKLSHTGQHIDTTIGVWRGVWLVCILFGLIAITRLTVSLKKPDFWVGVGAITVVGLALYQIIFESRARYLYLYVPLFIVLASYGFNYFRSFVLGLKNRYGKIVAK